VLSFLDNLDLPGAKQTKVENTKLNTQPAFSSVNLQRPVRPTSNISPALATPPKQPTMQQIPARSATRPLMSQVPARPNSANLPSVSSSGQQPPIAAQSQPSLPAPRETDVSSNQSNQRPSVVTARTQKTQLQASAQVLTPSPMTLPSSVVPTPKLEATEQNDWWGSVWNKAASATSKGLTSATTIAKSVVGDENVKMLMESGEEEYHKLSSSF
jgi:hypothetical protein